jgi:hypothetical protein
VNETRVNSDGQGKYGVFAELEGQSEKFYNSTRWVNTAEIAVNDDDILLSLKGRLDKRSIYYATGHADERGREYIRLESTVDWGRTWLCFKVLQARHEAGKAEYSISHFKTTLFT